MRFCQCEYCEQRRKREPPPELDVGWLLSVAAIVIALAVGGMCVAFLLQGPR